MSYKSIRISLAAYEKIWESRRPGESIKAYVDRLLEIKKEAKQR